MLEEVFIFLKAKVHNKEQLEMEEVHEVAADAAESEMVP